MITYRKPSKGKLHYTIEFNDDELEVIDSMVKKAMLKIGKLPKKKRLRKRRYKMCFNLVINNILRNYLKELNGEL